MKRLHLSAEGAAHRELAFASYLRAKEFDHVRPVLDAGADSMGGGYFIVMPVAEISLQDYCQGPIEEAAATDILRQIVSGLVELDDAVHRDLKPGNVLLHDGKWKIADLGKSRFPVRRFRRGGVATGSDLAGCRPIKTKRQRRLPE